MWVHDLADADSHCGGKAQNLARLIAAGLPVPRGFVIDDTAFRMIVGDLASDLASIGHTLDAATRNIARAEPPPELVADVARRAAMLGPLVAVRSSATIEDGDAGAAAGVFSSRRGVPVDQLWPAIRAVWTSALTPLAAAYARQRGGTISIAVIVQEFVAGERATIYSRPPGHPERDEVLVQRGDRLDRIAREPSGLAALAIAAERAIGAAHGADVEVVIAPAPPAPASSTATPQAPLSSAPASSTAPPQAHIVQARAIVHPQPRALVPAPPAILAPLGDGRVWRWDVAHNPDPLSPAQQGLVERVDRAGIAPYALRTCAGYLYYASTRTPEPPPLARAAELEARCAAALDEAHPPATVEDAIARYLAFYAIWAGELAPLIAAAPRAAGSRPSSIEATLIAAARGDIGEADAVARLGAIAPAWDVAVASYGERPAVILDAIARARGITLPTAPADPIADLAERDDLLFARAQQLVRRALLSRARELGIGEDDIFWLPLDEVAAAATLDADDAHRRAGAARAAAARAARWQMPVVVGGERSSESGTPSAGAVAADVPSRLGGHARPRVPLRGVGTGPRVTGRVVRLGSLASVISAAPGDVVVTRAVTPALAVVVVGCAAIVSETGGLLDHGAALARELGIPCVVDCHDAWSQLADGMIVTVDGDGGVVTAT